MTVEPPTARRNIGQLLREPYERFLAELLSGLAEAGYTDVTAAHGDHVLRHIERDGSRITEIAARARLTKQSVGYLVDHLEERGYVERIPDPRDGRAKVVRLTARGWEMTRVAEALIAGIEARWRERLGPCRWAHLCDDLADLIESAPGESKLR